MTLNSQTYLDGRKIYPNPAPLYSLPYDQSINNAVMKFPTDDEWWYCDFVFDVTVVGRERATPTSIVV